LKLKIRINDLIYRLIDAIGRRLALKGLHFLIRAYQFILGRFAPDFKDMYGCKLFLNRWDVDITPAIVTNTFERFETNIFQKIVKKGDIIVDLGTNIEYYTTLAAKLTGRKGKVYAFEPEPKNYELLVKNIRVNNLNDLVNTVRKAVSNKNGITRLFKSEESLGTHRLYADSLHKEFIEVETTTLDEFFKAKMHVDAIKMDIEGSEMLCLLGAQNLLNHNKNIKMLIEFYPAGILLTGYSPIVFLRKIKELGFCIFFIDSKERKIKLVDENDFQLLSIGGPVNLLILPTKGQNKSVNEIIDTLI
jgi:FkbM family methyltransferase